VDAGLSCDDVATRPLEPTGAAGGIDVGIASFAVTSEGRHIDNPRWGARAAGRLGMAEQVLARKKRGSANRQAARETVAARHRKVANCRRDFHHKTARALVADHDVIVVEDLKIANMVRRAKPHPDPHTPGGSPWLPWRLRTLDSWFASGVVLCSVGPLELVGSDLRDSRESGSRSTT